MLLEMHARNFLLFKEIDLSFSEGFNVITGETGSGKSMFVKLLRALSGEYKAKEIIGNFEDKFWIEAVFNGNEFNRKLLEEYEIPNEGEMVVRLSGTCERYTSRINGIIVPLSFLNKVMESEMEIHSQNAFQKLKNNVFHTKLIDRFAGSEISSKLTAYELAYKEYTDLLTLQKELPGNTSTVIRNLEFLEFQIKEIQEANIKNDEDIKVSDELKVLSNYEFIKNSLFDVINLLENNSDYPSISDSLYTVHQKLEKISELDESISKWNSEIEVIVDNLSEIGRNIFSFLDSFEYDEQELISLEMRMKVIENIKKKYGPKLQDVFDNYEKFVEEKKQILSKLNRIKTLDKEIEYKALELSGLDDEIKKIRLKFGEILSEKIMSELEELKMEKAEIKCEVEMLKEFTRMGKHLIEFNASMNPGLPFMPIAKIASGGELSRLYLAIEISIKGNLEISTIVFDEIDTGVGARLGDVIGKKISSLEEYKLQSFLITHLPQPAAIAKKHFRVGKKMIKNETISFVEELTGKIRADELKEMMGDIPKI